jgi:O-methyltransferase
MEASKSPETIPTNETGALPRELYLDLLKKCLTASLWDEVYAVVEPLPRNRFQDMMYLPLRAILRGLPFRVVRPVEKNVRAEGRDWPLTAETMIGMRRLEHLEECIVDILHRRVPGDLIETGVWRGGATIFMRAILKAYGDTLRNVWVADSFQGLPTPDSKKYPADHGDRHHTARNLAVPLDVVKRNFARYSLLDGQVRFLAGWFRDTLPSAPIETLALIRLDGDMYESTFEGLGFLYPKLSIGGYLIVDDYGNERLPCKKAVDDFRSKHRISEPIEQIDWTGVYWLRRE